MWQRWVAAAAHDEEIEPATVESESEASESPVDAEMWQQAVEGIAGLYVVKALEFIGGSDPSGTGDTQDEERRERSEAALNTIG